MSIVKDIAVDKKLIAEMYNDWGEGLKLPVVQRSFVWSPDRIRELIDSIIQNFPIGAVILLETNKNFPGSPLMDGNFNNSRSPTQTYVIDGQQRLTSLMLMKTGWTIKRGGKEISVDPITYNPSSKRFSVGLQGGMDISLLVNAALGSTGAISTLSARYPKHYQSAIADVGSRIIRYPLPTYTIKGYPTQMQEDDFAEEVAEIFTRVNSMGVKIGNLQMFLSFFAAAFSNYKDKLIEIHESLNEKYDVDFPTWEVLIRFLFSNLEMSQNQISKVKSFKKAVKEIRQRFTRSKKSQQELSRIIERSQQAIEVTLDVIGKDLGIYNANRISSQNALLPLFKWVYETGAKVESKISLIQRRRMLRWFIIAAFNGHYSAYPDSKLQKDITAVRESARFPTTTLFNNMKRSINVMTIQRSDISPSPYVAVDSMHGDGRAYLMLLNSLLHSSKASNWKGEVVTSRNTTVHHIFPRDFLRSKGVSDLDKIHDIGNLTLIDTGVNSEIGSTPPQDYLSSYSKSDLKHHFIPDSLSLYNIKHYDSFLMERSRMIWKGTLGFLNKLNR